MSFSMERLTKVRDLLQYFTPTMLAYELGVIQTIFGNLVWITKVYSMLMREVMDSDEQKKVVQTATWLARAGVDINHKDTYGVSPMHVAAAAGLTELVNFFVQNGAKVGNVNRGFLSDNATFACLRLLSVTFHHVDALNQNAVGLSDHRQNGTGATLVLAGQNHNIVAFFNLIHNRALLQNFGCK